MEFITVRDLRINTGRVWTKLRQEQELIITSNGHPIALMTGITPKNLEDMLNSVRQARGRLAISRIRKGAQTKGLDKMTFKEIDQEIKQTRQARRKRII